MILIKKLYLLMRILTEANTEMPPTIAGGLLTQENSTSYLGSL
jgi:hypothetical protein